jgi:nucleotide-binding universal stress UspA family protein
MPNIKRILLPVDFPNASLCVVHQAATLAHHFHSEIVMLHVVDMLAETVRWAQEQLDQSLGPELEGLTVQRVLVKGDPARAIVQTAQMEKADLIMMPSHGYTFNRFLLGSVTAKVLYGRECPIWTGAHVEESPGQEFAIRNVLCAIDFGPRRHKTVSWAAQMATEFGASYARARHCLGGALGAWRQLLQSRMERGACRRRFSASRRATARHGHQGRRIYRQW